MSKTSFRNVFRLQAAAIAVCGAQLAYAGDVSVNVNLGAPLPVVVAPPPAVYVPAPEPVYVAPPPPVYAPIVIDVRNDIDFVYPTALGFYVAVGVPYDLFYVNKSYFLYRDGRWLRARSSRGPWVEQRHRELPPALRRYKVERIREYRNREYDVYCRDRDHYRGRHFRSDKAHWKELRREAKAERREERRHEKELRREERRYEKEQHRDERRYEKEHRREERRHGKDERGRHRDGRDD